MLKRSKEVRLLLHDKKKRACLKKNWLKKILVSSLFFYTNITLLTKQLSIFSRSEVIFKLAARSFYRSRCLFSGRAKAVDSRIKLSRFSTRLVASGGLLSGVRRASW